MSLKINLREASGVTVVELDGRITLGEAASALRSSVKDVLALGARRIILDVSRVSYVDSSGLGELVGVYTSVRNAGGDVKLVGVDKKLQGLLQVTKLHTIFDCYDTAEGAMHAFATASGAGA